MDDLKAVIEALENARNGLKEIATLRPMGPTPSQLVYDLERLAIQHWDAADDALRAIKENQTTQEERGDG